MNASKLHDNDKNPIILSLVLLLLSLSPASALPDFLFPWVKVRLTNDANATVAYLCSFKNSNKALQPLQPRETKEWDFRQYLSPIHWCYVYVNADVQGFFWAYTLRKLCSKCNWSIRPDGAYFFESTTQGWQKMYLWTSKEAVDSGQNGKMG